MLTAFAIGVPLCLQDEVTYILYISLLVFSVRLCLETSQVHLDICVVIIGINCTFFSEMERCEVRNFVQLSMRYSFDFHFHYFTASCEVIDLVQLSMKY